MYRIRAPHDGYNRRTGGVQFVNGRAETDSAWLASWFSGRPGFEVTPDTPKNGRKKGKHDEENAAGAGDETAAGSAGGGA